jgi:hypothetical protein
MKRYKGADGERLWFEPSEIEHMMETELGKAGLMATADEPAVDMERFLEGHLGVDLDQYAPLDSEVLGVTEFRQGAPPKVSINKELTGSALDDGDSQGGILGRWRATLAHEAAHVLLHRILFEVNLDQGNLFGGSESVGGAQKLMRCLKREVSYGASGKDWREVQANRGMAAILMPVGLFREVTARILRQPTLEDGSPGEREAASRLAEAFKVSRQAASIRLRTLGFLTPPKQRTLLGDT